MNDQTHNHGEDQTAEEAFDEMFELRLKQHLRAELEPHVGSATAKFDAMLLADRRPSAWKIGLRWSAAAVVLLSFGIAIPMIASRSAHRPSIAPPIAIQDNRKPPADAILTSWSETVDAGTVLVDPETPARMLKRTRYEKAEWRDAAGQWQSAVTPADEDVILVDLQKQ